MSFPKLKLARRNGFIFYQIIKLTKKSTQSIKYKNTLLSLTSYTNNASTIFNKFNK